MWAFFAKKLDPAGQYTPLTPGAAVPLITTQYYPQLGRPLNDQLTYHFPPGQMDFGHNYNNVYWGNRLPNYSTNGLAGAPHVRTWAGQHSPELVPYQLTGGAYPYGMSNQQASGILSKMATAWSSAMGG